jgi:hypothetical protein
MPNPEMTFAIEPHRVLILKRYGRFYIMGNPVFDILYVPDPFDASRTGYIIIDETYTNAAGANPLTMNKLFKMTKDGKLIPALFKTREIAEEVCYACNKVVL